MDGGPLERFRLPDGTEVPFYVMKFDKRGTCVTPRSRDHLTGELERGGVTDVYLFSHGWNNSPTNAIAKYRGWITGYRNTLDEGGHQFDRPYHPVLVGVVWPSVWIVPWWERGPRIAAQGAGEEVDDAMIGELADVVPDDQREEFYALAESPTLTEDEARTFLRLLKPLYTDGDDDLSEAEGPSVDVLLAGWQELSRISDPVEFEPEDLDAPAVVGAPRDEEPQPAGLVGRAPIDGIRMLSVWQMKDRAATVGSNGVAELLRAILGAGKHQTHLAGHSFGAKVLLSAICSPHHPQLTRSVDSLLLLQPAINQYGLADEVPDRGRPGGYHAALGHVRQPILTTFTNNDLPLRKFFHIALRRRDDIGEALIAADKPPSDYAAMGGYGPRGVTSHLAMDIAQAGTAYGLGPDAPEVVSLRAHGRITGHGDIDNPFTHWALFSLVRGLVRAPDG